MSAFSICLFLENGKITGHFGPAVRRHWPGPSAHFSLQHTDPLSSSLLKSEGCREDKIG